MAGGVGVTFGGTDAGLTALQKKVLSGTKQQTVEYRNAARELKQQERAGLKALSSLDGASQKYRTTLRGLREMVRRGTITQEQATRAAKKYREQLERQGQTGFKLGQSLSGMAAGYLSISAAINTARVAYQTFLVNLREHQKLTRDVVDASRNFALLQPPETIAARRRQVGALGVQRGFFRTEEEQNSLFDMVQSIQSQLGGDFAKALQTTSRILQARRVGIPAELARELVTQAIAQRQADPTSFLRKALTAGQLSGRSAEEVSKSVPELQLFSDKSFGFSVAAKLTDVFGDRARTFVKASAKAFQVEIDRQKLGVGDEAPASAVLKALADQSVSTIKELKALGVGDIRGQQALLTLIANQEEVAREAGIITQKDVPGLLLAAQNMLEKNDPIFATARQLDIQQSEFQFRRAFSESTLAREQRDRGRGLRSLRRGQEQISGFDVMDERGNVGPIISKILAAQEVMQKFNDEFERLTGTVGVGTQLTMPSEAKFDEQTEILKQVRDRLPAVGNGQPVRPEG